MAWTNPKTWTDGEHVGASELNLHLRDNLNELRRGCITVANQPERNNLTGILSGQLVWQQDISRLLVYDGEFWREVPFSGSDLSYETLTIVATSNVAVYGSDTTTVDLEKIDTSDTWNGGAYSTQGWQAPVTLEFLAFGNASSHNGRSLFMASLNTDPTTNNSYTDLDYASYPYVGNYYEVYHNGSAVNPIERSWSTSELWRIVYATDGFIYHYNGSRLMYSVSTGSSTAVRYLDTAFNSYGHGVRRIRVIRKAWNGFRYV